MYRRRLFRTGRKAASIEYEIRSELFDYLRRAAILAQWRQKHRQHKQCEADDRKGPRVPQAQRENHQPRADCAEKNSESRPGAGARAEGKKFRKSAGHEKERVGDGIAKTRERGDSSRRWHLAWQNRRYGAGVHAGLGSLILAALAKTFAIEFTHCFRSQEALLRFFYIVDFAHARNGTSRTFPDTC